MSEISSLVDKLCPNGVEYLRLENVVKIMNGKDYKSFPEGTVPVYGTGGIMTYIDRAVYDKPSVLLPRKGSIDKVYYVDTPFWTVDTIYWTKINTEKLLPKFLYYYMTTINLAGMNTGTGAIPSLTQTVLKRIEIPVPPIEVQSKIVEILDNFAELTEELTAELTARQKQYEYYRDNLLSFNNIKRGGQNEVIWKTLFELGGFFGGLTGKSKSDFTDGNAKFITYMNVYSNSALKLDIEDKVKIAPDEKQNRIKHGDLLFTGSSETPDECGMSSVVVNEVLDDYYLNSFCFGFRLNDTSLFNLRFLKHLLRSGQIRNQIAKTASGVTRFNVSKSRFGRVSIPIPPIDEQNRIADILDKFESLSFSLTDGLPAEIKARQQQYEYYRDKLLTFKRKEVA